MVIVLICNFLSMQNSLKACVWMYMSWFPNLENPTKGKQGVQGAQAIPWGSGLQRQEPSQVTKQALSSGRIVKQRPAEASFRVRLRSKVTRATHSHGRGRGSSPA